MKWTQIPLGPLQTNAYVIWNEQNEAIIVDPGGEGPSLVKWLQQEKLNPIAILLTHAHYDHIGAIDDVRSQFNCPVFIHEIEQDWLQDPNKNGSARFIGGEISTSAPADKLISEEGALHVGPFTLNILETPGHSPGSISYYLENEAIVFSGDVLFAQGIGRTDLLGGDEQQLQKSHEKLLDLPEETIVACGHGNTTTVGRVVDENPFLSGF